MYANKKLGWKQFEGPCLKKRLALHPRKVYDCIWFFFFACRLRVILSF